MVLNLELIGVGIKPIFTITVPKMKKPINALFDTGSTKVIWCSAKTDIKELVFRDTHKTTTLSGFGTGKQEGCRIYEGSFGIYRAGRGIIFRDIEIVESTKKMEAFDLLLPYALFHEFEYTFKPASPDAKFGRLVVDTLSDRLVYGVKSYGGVVAEVYADEEDMDFDDTWLLGKGTNLLQNCQELSSF